MSSEYRLLVTVSQLTPLNLHNFRQHRTLLYIFWDFIVSFAIKFYAYLVFVKYTHHHHHLPILDITSNEPNNF